MTFETIELDIDDAGVARLTLNRPEIHNAMSAQLQVELLAAVRRLDADADVRAVVLTGAGESFCAGADLKWMKSVLGNSRAERVAGSAEVALLMMTLNGLSKPLIGRINGPAYGGGVGLVSVCDIAIGAANAKFMLSEVRLGLLPANIAPYVVARIGVRAARRSFLNAHLIGAEEARQIGLLDEVVAAGELDAAVERELADLMRCAPGAVRATKRLIAHVAYRDFRDSAVYTADRLADAWETDEGKEGIAAFLEKRQPAWCR
ncbi:MAG: crotonase/enoyl-CoA hydratase family protein [Alphaproteobacteria bacterium]